MDITEIIIAVIGLLGTIITAILVPYIKGKLNADRQRELARWVKIAVAAAEQLFAGSNMGQEKRAYVLKWLADNGYNVDDSRILSEVELLIEAFVSGLNGKSPKNDMIF